MWFNDIDIKTDHPQLFLKEKVRGTQKPSILYAKREAERESCDAAPLGGHSLSWFSALKIAAGVLLAPSHKLRHRKPLKHKTVMPDT